ncbi:MAG: YhcB family protein [Gammaproteobacteria bacterium]|nr:YhcB family protein [Gammaproteobacteria bacterium]
MEGSAITWVVGLIALAAGAGIGALVNRNLYLKNYRKRSAEMEAQLQDMQREQVLYRQKVDQHFSQSAQLLQEMASNYQKIYQHLSNGAQVLCENPPQQLTQPLEGNAHDATNDDVESPRLAPRYQTMDFDTETEMDNNHPPLGTGAAKNPVTGVA